MLAFRARDAQASNRAAFAVLGGASALLRNARKRAGGATKAGTVAHAFLSNSMYRLSGSILVCLKFRNSLSTMRIFVPASFGYAFKMSTSPSQSSAHGWPCLFKPE
jgi:hypothetical protein